MENKITKAMLREIVEANLKPLFDAVGESNCNHHELSVNVTEMVDLCHGLAASAGWWTNLHTGERLERNVAELLALCHSEVSESFEGLVYPCWPFESTIGQKSRKDDHLTHRDMYEVELVDVLVRILDMAGGTTGKLPHAISELCKLNNSTYYLDLLSGDHHDLDVAIHAKGLRFYYWPNYNMTYTQSIQYGALLNIHRAIDFALEGYRKGSYSDHHEHIDKYSIGLAVALLHTLAFAKEIEVDLVEIMIEKLEYNIDREDHKLENRKLKGGKKC